MNIDQLQKILHNYSLIGPHDSVIVAVSGGPDSVALLSLLCGCELDITLIPVYVDHGLRPEENEQEKDLVITLANHYNLHYEIVSIDVRSYQKSHNTSLEDSCRILRYQALEKQRKQHNADCIAVGHTADDQVEEFFLRLFRGSGAKGLSGMAMKSGNIIRPLLSTTKSDLLEYLHADKIKYCLDSSNTDLAITRNKVRHELLPIIEKHYNPSLRETILQTAEILRGDDNFLDRIVQQKMNACFHTHTPTSFSTIIGEINLVEFLELDLAIQRRLLEKIIWQCGSRPYFHHIEEIITTANLGRNGMELHLPKGLRLIKAETALQFFRPWQHQRRRGSISPPKIAPVKVVCNSTYTFPELSMVLQLHIRNQPLMTLDKQSIILDNNKISWPLLVRSPVPGERFSPKGMRGTKKISRFLTDAKVPRHERFQYPVLVSGETITAILGQRADNGFAADQFTTEWLVVSWLPLSMENQD